MSPKKPLLFIVGLAALLIATEGPAPIWTGNNGDPLRFTFREAQQLAERIIHQVRPVDMPPVDRRWFGARRERLADTLADTRYGWVQDEMPLDSCIQPGWARRSDPDIVCDRDDADCGPVLYLSFAHCGRYASQRSEIAPLLIQEACHHLASDSFDRCGDLAHSIFTAWDARQGSSRGLWLPMRLDGSPLYQDKHVLWLDDELVVWGGAETYSGDTYGAVYNPNTYRWQTMSTSGAPRGRLGTSATWTGSEMFVWGGASNASAAPERSGALYDPSANRWRAVSTSGAPHLAPGHSAVRLGTEATSNRILVWGRNAQDDTGLGAIFQPTPSGGQWTPIASRLAPRGRQDHLAVWTGRQMLVWGGRSSTGHLLGDGGIYDLASNSWKPMSNINAPDRGSRSAGVWTDRFFFVWESDETRASAHGRLYAPETDVWYDVRMPTFPVPKDPAVIWTGEKIVLVGSRHGDGDHGFGVAYDPLTERWSLLGSDDQIGTIYAPKAAWSGTSMFIWGGRDDTSGGSLAHAQTWQP